MLDQLESEGAWFSTAAQCVSWFKQRRLAQFEKVSSEGDIIEVKVTLKEDAADTPRLRLRFHRPAITQPQRGTAESEFEDIVLNRSGNFVFKTSRPSTELSRS